VVKIETSAWVQLSGENCVGLTIRSPDSLSISSVFDKLHLRKQMPTIALSRIRNRAENIETRKECKDCPSNLQSPTVTGMEKSI